MNRIIDAIEKEQFKTDATKFKIGDGVRVHTRVVEGDKERIQIFSGVVIGRRGHGLNEMFTVRRISYGEGVERVFPVHSPRVDKIEVERKGKTRRAKLTYLRRRLGKGATLVKEREAKAAPNVRVTISADEASTTGNAFQQVGRKNRPGVTQEQERTGRLTIATTLNGENGKK